MGIGSVCVCVASVAESWKGSEGFWVRVQGMWGQERSFAFWKFLCSA